MSEAVEDEVATKLQAGYRLAGPFKIPFMIPLGWNVDTLTALEF